ncbi:hypothetical protein [Bacillus sp. ISL-37]|uniref:hypothetical protein n=1 Tax=Bacillus sp. ISL-37 TaxID=2819123 RepID=UPI001BE8EC78|nr:hypothetical protein [Bacillus sp. ISL-37]MBT2686004.1 hypothetical protein [Bacillus sp. ISL-37]
MKHRYSLRRFNFLLFFWGVIFVGLQPLIFSFETTSFSMIFFSMGLPAMIIVGISAFFYYERLYIYSDHLIYRSLLKRIEVDYKEIAEIKMDRIQTSSGTEGAVRYYLIFLDPIGKRKAAVPFGFLKNHKVRADVIGLIKQSNSEIVIDQAILTKKEKMFSKVFMTMMLVLFFGIIFYFFYSSKI